MATDQLQSSKRRIVAFVMLIIYFLLWKKPAILPTAVATIVQVNYRIVCQRKYMISAVYRATKREGKMLGERDWIKNGQ